MADVPAATATLMELLNELVSSVRQTRHPFESATVTAERVWGLRRAPFGGLSLESFGFVGYLAIRRGQAPVGYPVSPDLEAAVLAGDPRAVGSAGGVLTLALLGFMTMAAERLNEEETASRPAS